MQAVTDFEATRSLIEYAVSVFRMRVDELNEIEDETRKDWIAKKIRGAWFRRSEEYWIRYANGEVGDSFERYEMTYKFRPRNYEWYAAKLEYAEHLLKKFDCATVRCQAEEITLSDDDLAFLSVSLQSTLEN